VVSAGRRSLQPFLRSELAVLADVPDRLAEALTVLRANHALLQARPR